MRERGGGLAFVLGSVDVGAGGWALFSHLLSRGRSVKMTNRCGALTKRMARSLHEGTIISKTAPGTGHWNWGFGAKFLPLPTSEDFNKTVPINRVVDALMPKYLMPGCLGMDTSDSQRVKHSRCERKQLSSKTAAMLRAVQDRSVRARAGPKQIPTRLHLLFVSVTYSPTFSSHQVMNTTLRRRLEPHERPLKQPSI